MRILEKIGLKTNRVKQLAETLATNKTMIRALAITDRYVSALPLKQAILAATNNKRFIKYQSDYSIRYKNGNTFQIISIKDLEETQQHERQPDIVLIDTYIKDQILTEAGRKYGKSKIRIFKDDKIE